MSLQSAIGHCELADCVKPEITAILGRGPQAIASELDPFAAMRFLWKFCALALTLSGDWL